MKSWFKHLKFFIKANENDAKHLSSGGMPLFDRAAKVSQKQRALFDGRLNLSVQYIRESIARNICERIEVRISLCCLSSAEIM